MSQKKKKLITKVKSNEDITKASLKLKQRIPLSPKVLPNNLQKKEDMQDLVTLGQIKNRKEENPFKKNSTARVKM